MDDVNKPLREHFDKIDVDVLAAMKNRREEESFNLDFKRMDQSGEPSGFDIDNLRKAISGYANAAGGIILWGVESKTPDDRRDRSRFQCIVPVVNGELAVVRFHELTTTATQPPVSGVVHKAIPVEGGFVVKTFVPASDGGPHRTNEEKGQYFRRDADAFRAMQHHEIADMFGRRARPSLVLWRSTLEPQSLYNSGQLLGSQIMIGLENRGRGLARFPMLVIERTAGIVKDFRFGLDGNGNVGLTRQVQATNAEQIIYAGSVGDVVHPESTLKISHIALGSRDGKGASFRYRIHAEGAAVVEGEIGFSEAEMQEASRRRSS